jgi:hypothetical protein
MSTFRLSPTEDGTGNEDWLASTYKGICHVGANGEEEARQFAAKEFASKAKDTGKTPRVSPWKQADLTDCIEVRSIGAPVPHGTVPIPDKSNPSKLE